MTDYKIKYNIIKDYMSSSNDKSFNTTINKIINYDYLVSTIKKDTRLMFDLIVSEDPEIIFKYNGKGETILTMAIKENNEHFINLILQSDKNCEILRTVNSKGEDPRILSLSNGLYKNYPIIQDEFDENIFKLNVKSTSTNNRIACFNNEIIHFYIRNRDNFCLTEDPNFFKNLMNSDNPEKYVEMFISTLVVCFNEFDNLVFFFNNYKDKVFDTLCKTKKITFSATHNGLNIIDHMIGQEMQYRTMGNFEKILCSLLDLGLKMSYKIDTLFIYIITHKMVMSLEKLFELGHFPQDSLYRRYRTDFSEQQKSIILKHLPWAFDDCIINIVDMEMVEKENKEIYFCKICHEHRCDISLQFCKHAICKICFDLFTNQQQFVKCPFCRGRVDVKSIIPITYDITKKESGKNIVLFS